MTTAVEVFAPQKSQWCSLTPDVRPVPAPLRHTPAHSSPHPPRRHGHGYPKQTTHPLQYRAVKSISKLVFVYFSNAQTGMACHKRGRHHYGLITIALTGN